MNILKQIVKATTGYWIHKIETLPIGADLFYDITQRLGYGNLKTVFDVGANEGQTVKWIKHHQPSAKIYSFEPVQSTYNRLQKNISQFSNCIAEHFAFGEKAGEQKIRLFSDLSVLNSLKADAMNKTENAKEELIKIETLDEYCKRKLINKIDFLKIDTEGYEMNVLLGAEQMITDKKISFIYCEVGFNETNKRNTSFENLTSYLASKGYYFYALYQLDAHDWKAGNHLGNALYIQKFVYP